MGASTNLIADSGTVVTTGPAAATKTKTIAEAGPIMDYVGNINSLALMMREASVKMTRIISVTDAGDNNLTGLTAVAHALSGLANPDGTLITTLQTAYDAGPAAATKAKAIAATGPIMDYPGMVDSVIRSLKDASQLLGYIIKATDSGDTNLTALNNIATALS